MKKKIQIRRRYYRRMVNRMISSSPKNATFLDIKPSVNTITAVEKPGFDQWMKEFNVSLLHGKNVRHFNF
jgi:hypothetical protein